VCGRSSLIVVVSNLIALKLGVILLSLVLLDARNVSINFFAIEVRYRLQYRLMQRKWTSSTTTSANKAMDRKKYGLWGRYLMKHLC